MTANAVQPPKVLIVEDETDLAALYKNFLEPSSTVRTAHTGEDAIEMLTFDPDIVLLDRHLPDILGDTVLEAILDRTVDARIAMVTAENPDFDIIRKGIDDYLQKPVTKSELNATVERLLSLDQLQEKQAELSSKRLKRNLLEVEQPPDELAESEEFANLEREIRMLEAAVADLQTAIDGMPESQQLVA